VKDPHCKRKKDKCAGEKWHRTKVRWLGERGKLKETSPAENGRHSWAKKEKNRRQRTNRGEGQELALTYRDGKDEKEKLTKNRRG